MKPFKNTNSKIMNNMKATIQIILKKNKKKYINFLFKIQVKCNNNNNLVKIKKILLNINKLELSKIFLKKKGNL